ncbi:MAG TPA: response regulator transcription factor, partial [Solirubrobacterales bacterium]|nr:response regulator transcription factor [Solirubrobacterales bacterium]
MKGSILIVEDEQAIADLVRAYLKRDGFDVVWARSGEQALEELARHPVRLVVLDIGLPGIDGFEVCRRLRGRTGVPILILSARDDEVDRVAGLEAGADDYVTKPFSPRELTARVKAILRRTSTGAARLDGGALSVGDVELDRASRTVTVGGEPVELTSREFDLLA